MILRIVLSITAALFFCPSEAQTISTIAGGGHSQDASGLPATAAQLNNPYGLATGHNGEIFFADRNNHRICAIEPSGNLTSIAGTGKAGYTGDGHPARKAAINYPIGIALDHAGNIFFSDRYNNCIRKINERGIITTVAGTGRPGYSGDGGEAAFAQINGPAGVAIDNNGNLLFCDAHNNCIRQVSPKGVITTIGGGASKSYYGEGHLGEAELSEPYGIAIDATGNIFFTEYGGQRIRMIDPSGFASTIAGTGAAGYDGDGGPATLARLNHPTGIALTHGGEIIIADGDNNRIRRIDRQGLITSLAGTGAASFGGDGGPAVAAAINGPAGIAIDTAGNIYFSDLGNNRIRQITPAVETEWLADSSLSVKVTTNPGEQALRFDCPSPGDYTATLFDANGRQLAAAESGNSATIVFSLKGFARGVYLFEIRKNGHVQKGKFMVE